MTSETREIEKVRDALWGFVLGGQMAIIEGEGTARKVQIKYKTITPEMRKLIFDFPIGTQFDIFIRKRE